MVKIQPVEFPFLGTAKKMLVHVQGFDTDSETCIINYQLLTDSGVVVLSQSHQLTPEEFQGWGEDNSYLEQIAADRIPVVIIPEPTA